MLTLGSYGSLLAQATENWWTAQFFGLDPDKRFVLLFVALIAIIVVIVTSVATVLGTIGSIYRRRAEMDLKREMIERGLSADEITKIIEAAPPPEDATQRWIASWAKSKKT